MSDQKAVEEEEVEDAEREERVEFREHQVFDTFKDFENHLLTYERQNFCKFSIQKSEKIRKRNPDDPNEEEHPLKYVYVNYYCKHFGDKRLNKNATAERPFQK